jgi:hypothetical protein
MQRSRAPTVFFLYQAKTKRRLTIHHVHSDVSVERKSQNNLRDVLLTYVLH